MKIALINGSPKIKRSSSNSILEIVKTLLEKETTIITEYHFAKPNIEIKDMEQFIDFDAIVFAFPLYVDGIPSHLVNCLIQLEDYISTNKTKDIMVYSIVNCGFYEAHQNKIAIEIMENWCIKTGLNWGQGVGIGAGGMLSSIRGIPFGQGPRKNIDIALTQLANNIVGCNSQENIFTSPNFPRIAYKFLAERGFRQAIRAHGLKTRDIHLRK